MTREEIILKHIKRNGRGIEIGPGCAPVAPKKQGFRVHVLDHCDKQALIEKYRAARDQPRQHRGGRFRLGWPALRRAHRPAPRLRLDHRVARPRTHHRSDGVSQRL